MCSTYLQNNAKIANFVFAGTFKQLSLCSSLTFRVVVSDYGVSQAMWAKKHDAIQVFVIFNLYH